ncbi:esterase-like activity of phytase family protein [Sphingomonas endophytica]|uniref:Phytase-like domain-containing protein n=1 Tax=Sphingomonas endophytica TaxID=869719 RepID=A0A147I6Z2_9SPHN|nr:esterase-like activity of phytase family protein [Sphingomonas endophytica]KTT74691.1 hypothetical protein NS334_04750 [Sphingomonas endophytica]
MRWPIALMMTVLLVPPWSGEPRRALYRHDLTVRATRFVPPGGWPRRIGVLRPVGAVVLSADQAGFGGFSALALHRGQAVLLTDGGLVVRLRIAGGTVRTLPGSMLDDGPETGWRRQARDTESMVVDPASGRTWIGYERVNEIWRYASGLAHAEGWARPAAMRGWGENSGPESLVRLVDGRFLTLREGGLRQVGARPALLFAGDPTQPGTAVATLRYLPPAGFAPSDAAVLPDGDVLVLNRRWRVPLRFEAALVRIAAASIRPGALLHGPVVARLGATLGNENAEGVAVSRERGVTMIWLITDNDGYAWRKTILAKFRLID